LHRGRRPYMTHSTIDAVLAQIRKDQAAYRHSHSEDITFIRSSIELAKTKLMNGG